MTKDDLDFFTSNLGFNWIEQLKSYLESESIPVESLKIFCTLSGLQKDVDKTNLIVIGKVLVREILHKFTAKFRLSPYWQIPGESIFQLYWIDYESISS